MLSGLLCLGLIAALAVASPDAVTDPVSFGGEWVLERDDPKAGDVFNAWLILRGYPDEDVPKITVEVHSPSSIKQWLVPAGAIRCDPNVPALARWEGSLPRAPATQTLFACAQGQTPQVVRLVAFVQWTSTRKGVHNKAIASDPIRVRPRWEPGSLFLTILTGFAGFLAGILGPLLQDHLKERIKHRQLRHALLQCLTKELGPELFENQRRLDVYIAAPPASAPPVLLTSGHNSLLAVIEVIQTKDKATFHRLTALYDQIRAFNKASHANRQDEARRIATEISHLLS